MLEYCRNGCSDGSFNVDDRLGTARQIAPEEKVRTFSEMPALLARMRRAGTKVVLAQGVFDIVHLGHVGYLRASLRAIPEKSILVVGVENDEAVRRNKGLSRPINPIADRLQVLSEFMSVGIVFAFDDVPDYLRQEDFVDRYKALGRAVIAVPQWDPHRQLKERQAEEAGGQLALIDYRHENSTTLMLARLGFGDRQASQ
jgi:D-beta-D-heptose 7-phosphate kinase/D-beta-D-heptose 1-phosphate adenosyltransferase